MCNGLAVNLTAELSRENKTSTFTDKLRSNGRCLDTRRLCLRFICLNFVVPNRFLPGPRANNYQEEIDVPIVQKRVRKIPVHMDNIIHVRLRIVTFFCIILTFCVHDKYGRFYFYFTKIVCCKVQGTYAIRVNYVILSVNHDD